MSVAQKTGVSETRGPMRHVQARGGKRPRGRAPWEEGPGSHVVPGKAPQHLTGMRDTGVPSEGHMSAPGNPEIQGSEKRPCKRRSLRRRIRVRVRVRVLFPCLFWGRARAALGDAGFDRQN